ncbi:hypothetical protein B0T20DRAFT_193828 [Sordaria brevicollis]|uniref:Uncharacterized protein n=1 Tax=Sordaria brevicollis TaxID=83679 RepID=A0AAE0PFY3_SORBR|nr:hypothetical protein B0T20DRAFT_193828 [Sordaria brevicollis]
MRADIAGFRAILCSLWQFFGSQAENLGLALPANASWSHPDAPRIPRSEARYRLPQVIRRHHLTSSPGYAGGPSCLGFVTVATTIFFHGVEGKMLSGNLDNLEIVVE